ncbi:MAG: thioredoxin [Clostridia bacterium]|nr:thioredoxin [Clostridia bacterium]
MITELNDTNYDEVIQSGKAVVIEFYTQTCPHCKRTQKAIQELDAEQDGQVIFAQSDIAAAPALAARMDIQSVPTILFVRNGEIKDKRIGFTHKLIIAETMKKI